MAKKQIRLNESQLKQIVNECVKNVLNEANSYGWEVDSSEATLAYEYMAQEIGNEDLNAAIVRAMGNSALADIMAYLLRMYDMRGWEEYRDTHI
jgi:predicted Fe-Mo cluster-binding NifX family protein